MNNNLYVLLINLTCAYFCTPTRGKITFNSTYQRPLTIQTALDIYFITAKVLIRITRTRTSIIRILDNVAINWQALKH